MPPPRYQQIQVDRVIGSHWIQEYLHRDPTGRYVRLPVLYHIGERRWVHSLGAFLAAESDDFWARSRGANWNESCLYCHNTEPSKNPIRDVRGSTAGYETEVAELGIACAACHGTKGQGNAALQSPALAARSDWYLVTQLKNFREGLRGADARDTFGAQMRAIFTSLPDDKAITDVVAYINTF